MDKELIINQAYTFGKLRVAPMVDRNGKDVQFIGFEDLVECKEKSNRMKDLLDVKNLIELRKLRDQNQNSIKDFLKPKSNKDNNSDNNFGISF